MLLINISNVINKFSDLVGENLNDKPKKWTSPVPEKETKSE